MLSLPRCHAAAFVIIDSNSVVVNTAAPLPTLQAAVSDQHCNAIQVPLNSLFTVSAAIWLTLTHGK